MSAAQQGLQERSGRSGSPGRRFLRRLAPTRRGLRFASGLLLFVYLTTHLVNHALGLVSLSVAEAGLDYAMTVWQSRPGTILLYGSALAHIGLAFEAVYQRRTLRRMPFRDLLRIALGLNLPVLLIAHAASTRLAMELYDYQLFYADVVRDLWQTSSQTRQFAILAPGWIHGCLGLQAAFGARWWWRKSLPVLFGLFLVLPILSALGFLEMQRELTWFGTMDPKGHGPSVQTMTGIAQWRDRAVDAYIWLVAALFAARALRWVWERARGATIDIAYPGLTVRTPAGWSVLETSRANHIPHASACGGRARCSTCRVRVIEGLENCPPPGRNETLTLERISAAPDTRLACQLRPTGPVMVATLDGLQGSTTQAVHEEVCVIVVLDICNRRGLAEAMLPQDLRWTLSETLRVFENAVHRMRGHALSIGAEQAVACFPVGRDAKRAARLALAALREVQSELARIAVSLEDHWKASLDVRLVAHVGPILIDPAVLASREGRALAVGRAINEIDRARHAASGQWILLVSNDLLDLADEKIEGYETSPLGVDGLGFLQFTRKMLV